MASSDVSDGEVDKSTMMMVADSVSSDWKMLARELDLSEGVIKQISTDYFHEGVTEMCYQALYRWKREAHKATIRTLAYHLTQRGHAALAIEIIQQAASNKSAEDSKVVPVADTEDRKLKFNAHKKLQNSNDNQPIARQARESSSVKHKSVDKGSESQTHTTTDRLQRSEMKHGCELVSNKSAKFKQNSEKFKSTNASQKISNERMSLDFKNPTTKNEPPKGSTFSKQNSIPERSDFKKKSSIDNKSKQESHMGGPKADAELTKGGSNRKKSKASKKKLQPQVNIPPAETTEAKSLGRPDSVNKSSKCEQERSSTAEDLQVEAEVLQLNSTPKQDVDLMKCHVGALVVDGLRYLICMSEEFKEYSLAVDHLKTETHKACMKNSTISLPENWKTRLITLQARRKEERGLAQIAVNKAEITVDMFLTKHCTLCKKEIFTYQPKLDHLDSLGHKKKLG